MSNLPMELINKIMSFVERPKCVKIMKYVIKYCKIINYKTIIRNEYN